MTSQPEQRKIPDLSPVSPIELEYSMTLFCAAVSGRVPIRCKLSALFCGSPAEVTQAGMRVDGITLSDADLMEVGMDALQRDFERHPHLFALVSRTCSLFLFYQHCGSRLEDRKLSDIFEAAAKTPMMKNGGFGPKTFLKCLDRVTNKNAKTRLEAARS
jgi:hypothetical protein